jgi:hypothetical protein
MSAALLCCHNRKNIEMINDTANSCKRAHLQLWRNTFTGQFPVGGHTGFKPATGKTHTFDNLFSKSEKACIKISFIL